MAAESTHETLLAEGWKERALPGFMGHAGPLWTRREGDAWAYGMHLEDKHLPGVNYLGRSTSIILAGGSEA